MHTSDFTPKLRQALHLARSAGLTESAAELEAQCFAAYTTSSEMLGEMGEAIMRFRSREGSRIPPEVDALLNECQQEIGKVWPRYRPGSFYRFLRMFSTNRAGA